MRELAHTQRYFLLFFFLFSHRGLHDWRMQEIEVHAPLALHVAAKRALQPHKSFTKAVETSKKACEAGFTAAASFLADEAFR
jgi:hypothetical protein